MDKDERTRQPGVPDAAGDGPDGKTSTDRRDGRDGRDGKEDQAGAETARAGEGDDVARARADIGETRARMAETIDELQERLDPRHLADEAGEGLRAAGGATVERAGQVASDATGTARDAARGLFARLKGVLARRGAQG